MANDPNRKVTLPNYHQIPQGFLTRVAQTLAEGEREYGEWNFIERRPSRRFICDVYNHAFKHLCAVAAGQSDEDHLAHAVVNLMFLMAYEDRGWLPKDEIQQGYYETPEEVITPPSSPHRVNETEPAPTPLATPPSPEDAPKPVAPTVDDYRRDFIANLQRIAAQHQAAQAQLQKDNT